MLKICEDKLTNGLIGTNEMIELIERSHDNAKEKQSAIEYLRGMRMDIKKSPSEYVNKSTTGKVS